MTWFTGILVYVIIWWLVLFMVLPWGVKVPEEPEPGHASSAPVQLAALRQRVAHEEGVQ